MEKFSKILKFADKDGNKHSYMANFIDGEISPEDKRNIEKLKNGERLEEKKETSTSDNEMQKVRKKMSRKKSTPTTTVKSKKTKWQTSKSPLTTMPPKTKKAVTIFPLRQGDNL